MVQWITEVIILGYGHTHANFIMVIERPSLNLSNKLVVAASCRISCEATRLCSKKSSWAPKISIPFRSRLPSTKGDWAPLERSPEQKLYRLMDWPTWQIFQSVTYRCYPGCQRLFFCLEEGKLTSGCTNTEPRFRAVLLPGKPHFS